jgi:hypothetical protein
MSEIEKNKSIKVTDLERFAQNHIFLPYLTWLSKTHEIPSRGYFTLDELVDLLAEKTRWSYLILDRIDRLQFHFPDYINHELIKVIKSRIKQGLDKTIWDISEPEIEERHERD